MIDLTFPLDLLRCSSPCDDYYKHVACLFCSFERVNVARVNKVKNSANKDHLERVAPERRELDYVRQTGASVDTAKEVKIFGLNAFLIERYRLLADKIYQENRRLAARRAGWGGLLTALGTLGYYVAYAFLAWRTLRGALTIGDLTFLAGSFRRLRNLLEGLLIGFSQGGTVSLGYALSHPDRELRILNFSGFLADHPAVNATPDTVRNARIFWGHGTSDPAIPFALAVEGEARGTSKLFYRVPVGVVHADAADLAFRHDLVRSALYEEIPEALRRPIHRSIADALLSGEGGHLVVRDPQALEEIRRELASTNPILGIYRDYPTRYEDQFGNDLVVDV